MNCLSVTARNLPKSPKIQGKRERPCVNGRSWVDSRLLNPKTDLRTQNSPMAEVSKGLEGIVANGSALIRQYGQRTRVRAAGPLLPLPLLHSLGDRDLFPLLSSARSAYNIHRQGQSIRHTPTKPDTRRRENRDNRTNTVSANCDSRTS